MLKITKKGDKYWLFEDSEIGLFSPSKFTINLELNDIVIVYENGLKSKRYNVIDCEIYDLGELTPFTTSSGDLFMQKLEELNCPCFHKDENNFFGNNFDPANFDLEEFTNTSTNPFIRQDELGNFDEFIEGYFDGTNFYTDALFTNLITPELNKYYVDLATTPSKIYRWSGTTFVAVGGGAPQLRTDKHVFFFTNPSLAASTSWYSQRYDVANGIYDSLWLTGSYNGTTGVVNDGRLLSHAITFNQKATKITIDYAFFSVTGTFRIIYFKPINNGASNYGIDNLIIHEFTIVNAVVFRKKLIEIPVDITMEAGGNIACVAFNNNTTLVVKGMNITVESLEVV